MLTIAHKTIFGLTIVSIMTLNLNAHAQEMTFTKSSVASTTVVKHKQRPQVRGTPKYECKRKRRFCPEYKENRCVRYENKFECWFPDPKATQCDPAAKVNPTPGIANCSVVSTTCKQMVGTHCAETETQLLCNSYPSGEGVTVQEPKTELSYNTTTDGALEPGCRITAERCVDSTPREIPISNWPNHTTSANPPCWEKTFEVSCPTDTHANACKALEAAGCVREKARVCEVNVDGVCTRWSSTYRCHGFEIKGSDIQTDQTIDWKN